MKVECTRSSFSVSATSMRDCGDVDSLGRQATCQSSRSYFQFPRDATTAVQLQGRCFFCPSTRLPGIRRKGLAVGSTWLSHKGRLNCRPRIRNSAIDLGYSRVALDHFGECYDQNASPYQHMPSAVQVGGSPRCTRLTDNVGSN